MSTIKAWVGTMMVVSSACAFGACSGDDEPDESAAGTGAGASAAGASGASGSSGSSGNGSGGPPADPNQPAAPGVPPTFIPNFPGSGTSGDDAPLTNGELCDYVPLNGAPTPAEITTCFFSGDDPNPAATMEQVLECVDGADVVHIRLTFNPTFVDNTYGVNAIGWGETDEPMMPPAGMMKPPKGGKDGHTFRDLYHSDHAEIALQDEDGKTVMQFKLDYISEDPTAVSGYASLGVSGGDGELIVGEEAWLLDYQTSAETNLNVRGYSSYIVDSPATDENYTPNPETPEWDYRYVFEAWIDVKAFGDAGFGTAIIESVHASPSKAESNTIEVEPGECPPCDPRQPDIECTPSNPPDGGTDMPPPDGGTDVPPGDGVCDGTQLDIDCSDAGPPDGGNFPGCTDPNDPRCDPM